VNNRERRLVVLLGVFVLGGLAFAGYGLVVSPLDDLKTEAAKLEEEISTKGVLVDKLRKDQKRADLLEKRSLPSDVDTARNEYQAMMQKLLRQARVPGGYTITPKDSMDAKNIPVLDPKTKKPAYTKLAFDIKIIKVDVDRLAKFLQAYYQLNLLHQITKLEIIRKDSEGGGGRLRSLIATADRADLEVRILTEAVILDGAENRKTLLPMPSVESAAVAGGPGFAALSNTQEVARAISPLQLANVLAAGDPPREYTLLTAKDLFHGPLPPLTAPPVEVVQKDPPKEDISPFIKMTGITRRSDGSIKVDLFDQANNQDYQIDLTPKGERYEVKVQKLYYINPTKRGKYYSEPTLTIQEEYASTNRTFKVVGTHDDVVVLTETATFADAKPDAEKTKVVVRAGPPGRGDAKPKLPAPPPASAVLGGAGLAMVPAGEKVFAWRVGQTLKSLTELPAKDADAALRKAAPMPVASATDPPQTSSPVSVVENE
jgi:hypothetical protein